MMKFMTYVNKKYTDADVEAARCWLINELDMFILENGENEKMKNIRNSLLKSQGSHMASRYGLTTDIIFADSELINAYNRKADALKYLEYRYDFKYYPKNYIQRSFPLVVAVEASSRCNLRCMMCFQAHMDQQNYHQNRGIMDDETYERFLNEIENNRLYSIVFASRGEPLLNPNIDKMIKAAKDRGVLDIKLNTNAVMLTDDMSRRLLASGLDMIVFSVDSLNPKHYETIRGTSLESVKNNINNFLEIRKKEFPDSNIVVRVAMVVTNKYLECAETEIDEAKRYWLERVDELSVKSENDFSAVYDANDVHDVAQTCSLLWERVYLWYDGSINPCDIDHLSTMELGNITTGDTIAGIWSGDKMNVLRRKHLESRDCIGNVCDHCVGY